ncbi:coiled-coil domain-containing protein 39-like isoform X1 [Hemibagrus wyckioides]|uniref:coiled-coil domain-containing protein 39-like isoform X1 n=1 Tax=Hemibagrus wyckioides TaxID=337641 RepID=UPI00266C9053|nr:coiled-coil domain-containing protein 39-like isoform X1 [Hemibagrus wyckioides]XP_058251670.1 coiled-coil domain-containing protein 39-like isoform X1 [Hemibagrus wyckioides]
MANAVMSGLLTEIGWDRKFAIPVSNTENKSLEDKIQRKQKDRANVENRVSKLKDRISAMTEHTKNVQQERIHSQALCRAVEKQTESGLHFKALSDREKGRLRQEISQQQSELKSLRERKNSKENNIFKATQKIEVLKGQVNMDQQTLDAWWEESARKDEDIMTIVKYAQQDESRIRELTLNIDKQTLEANRKRKALENEATETIMAQVAVEKTAELVQQANVERQELITQWENSIAQMRKKDQDLQQCALLLVEINQMIRERKALLNEKQNFLAYEVDNNKDCEKKIVAAERQANRLWQQFQEEESNRTRLQDELVSLKGRVDRTATDLEAKRSHLASIKKDINIKTAKLEDTQQYIIALEAKLQGVTEEALSVEERAAQMEKLHRDQEKHLKELDTQLQRENKLLFQKTQELQTLRAKEKNVIADISGSRVALSSLDNRLSKLDQNVLRQQDYINNQEFQIQYLEGKMARLSGNVNEEEKQVLENQVSELSAVLEEKKRAADLLAAQLKKLQNDIRFVGKENEKTGADKQDLTTKIEELNLVDDTLNKELKRLCLKKQDSIVENNIQQLEVKRLRTLLYDRADGVLSQEKRKLQLRTSMKERQKEICVHREMCTKQLKITEQEIQRLSAQLHERLSKVDKMKKKYEIVNISMAAPEGEEDKSQAYYIIKAAQEKEELQCKGDDLDAKIRIAEKENKALENTVHLLNNHNSAYRKSFNKVTESSPEYQEKLKLEEQKRAADEKGKFKRRQIRELQENFEVMSSSLNSLQQEEAAQRQKNADLEALIVSFKAELISQQEKQDRATKQSLKLTKEVRSSKNTEEETFEERDLNQKVLKDCKKTVNKLFLEVMEQHPDLQETLQTYFMQAGLALPSPAPTPSSRSSKLSSARSSVSLRSSRFSGPSAANSARGLAVHSPSVKKIDLGLGLAVSSALSPQSLGSDSSRSSNSNRSSRSIRSSHLKNP